MSVQATFDHVPPAELLPPDPDPRDRTTAAYREHRDTVMRPDIRVRRIQVPLLAYREGDRRRVFEGGTRLECALLEALPTVPVLTFPAPPTDRDRKVATFLANENRLDFTPVERARFYLDVMRAENWTQAELCRQVPGLKPARVSKTLKWLEKLLPDYQGKVGEGDGLIPERSAYKLCDYPPERQQELAEKTIKGLLTVEALEAMHDRDFGKAERRPKAARLALKGMTVVLSVADFEAALAQVATLSEAIKRAQRNGLPLVSVRELLRG